MVDSLAPFVPSETNVVKRMLEIAQAGPDDVVVDLGCGDGRILIAAVKDFGAKRAVGYEMRSDLYKQILNDVKRQGLAERITVFNGDLLKADLSQATVITLYLTTSGNERLRSKFINEVKDGTRIVSHDFRITGWSTSIEEKLKGSFGSKIYLYIMPDAITNNKGVTSSYRFKSDYF